MHDSYEIGDGACGEIPFQIPTNFDSFYLPRESGSRMFQAHQNSNS